MHATKYIIYIYVSCAMLRNSGDCDLLFDVRVLWLVETFHPPGFQRLFSVSALVGELLCEETDETSETGS